LGTAFDEFSQQLTLLLIKTVRQYPDLSHYPAEWGPSFRWPGNRDWIYSEFYSRYIDPYLAEAAGNCALTEVLDYRIKALESLASQYGGTSTATIGSGLVLCAGYKECIKEIDSCCLNQGLGGQDSVLDAQVIADKAAAIGCSIAQSDLNLVAKDCLPTWSGSILIVHTVSNYSAIVNGPLSSETKVVQAVTARYTTDAVGLSGNTAGQGVYGLTGSLKGFAYFTYTEDFHSVDNSCCAGCTSIEHVQGGNTARGTAMANFAWRLTNSPPPVFPIPLFNTVTPNNDLTLSANQIPFAGSQVNVDSGMVTDPATGQDTCETFAPDVLEISGTSGFANLLPYIVTDSGVLGTLIQYQGTWSTNQVSSDGLTTTSVEAIWNFKHN
jgi:hypothetical protein